MNKEILKAVDVTKTFSDGTNQITVLDKVNFSLQKGDFVAIIGASGGGKSTFLHLLGGLDNVTSGQICFEGRNFAAFSDSERDKIHQEKIGFVYQFHHLLAEFNVLENVEIPLLLRGMKKKIAKELAQEALFQVGLEKRLAHKIGQISGGERQRVAIARAIVGGKECVLADEPTGNLDHKTTQAIFDLLLKINEKKKTAFVIATHDLELVKDISATFLIENGKLQQYQKENR